LENVFDEYKAHTFSAIATTMGYDAECRGMTARVLFNQPSKNEKVADYEYSYDRPTLEFKIGDWPGIREAIDAKENVIINVRSKEYLALRIDGERNAARDGETYLVYLQEI